MPINYPRCRELFSQQGFDDCKDLPQSPIEAFINNCIMDICGGGDPTVVSCDTLDALVELCEELTGEQIKNLTSECGMYRQHYIDSILLYNINSSKLN